MTTCRRRLLLLMACLRNTLPLTTRKCVWYLVLVYQARLTFLEGERWSGVIDNLVFDIHSVCTYMYMYPFAVMRVQLRVGGGPGSGVLMAFLRSRPMPV